MHPYRTDIRQLMIAVNVIDGIYDMISKKIGIKINALTLLYALDDGRPHSQKEICEEWCIPPTTLNTIVQESIKSGYIFLNADTGRKEKEICLTEKGSAFAQTVLSQVYELEQSAMERTVLDHDPEFVRALDTFADHLKEEVNRFPPHAVPRP